MMASSPRVSGDKFDWLVKALHTGGFGARGFELLNGVFLGFALPATASVTAFEFIVGDHFDVIPPGLAVKMRGALG
jgi:hypothetical protein